MFVCFQRVKRKWKWTMPIWRHKWTWGSSRRVWEATRPGQRGSKDTTTMELSPRVMSYVSFRSSTFHNGVVVSFDPRCPGLVASQTRLEAPQVHSCLHIDMVHFHFLLTLWKQPNILLSFNSQFVAWFCSLSLSHQAWDHFPELVNWSWWENR